MIKKVIIEIIDKAIFEIEEYIEKYHIPQNSSLTTGHIKVLLLLKDEIIQNKIDINERVLRAFKDVCTSTAIEHEESIFHNSVF